MRHIQLIHWNEAEAKPRLATLRSAGYRVGFEPFSPALLRKLRETPPDAVVIDLTRLPSQGRDVALMIRQYKPLRRVPLVFVEGDPEKVKRIQSLLPDAAFTSWRNVRSALKRAIANPPKDPVIPTSNLAGYAGTPLPKKLGIKGGTVTVLVSAPDAFEKTLGALPKGATLKRSARGKHDLTLWFVTSHTELERRMASMAKIAGDALWIVWAKKGSAHDAGLTQADVRKTGLAAGLVDYKIAAIDATWSGLKFTRRK
jgi:CheY-like chemotaxis protein